MKKKTTKETTPSFYDEKIEEISSLIKNKKIEEAMKELQIELGMPYIPKEKEEKLQALYIELIQSLKSDEKIGKTLSPESVIEYLNDNDNPVRQTIALDAMRRVNLREIAEDLKKWVEDPKNDWNKPAKVVITESLISQKISVIIKMGNKEIDCSISDSILESYNVKMAIKEVIDLTEKEPQIQKLAQQVLQGLLISNYPYFPSIDRLSEKVINITRKMLGEEVEFDDVEKLMYKKIMNYF